MAFPNFSNISSYAANAILRKKNAEIENSKLNCYVRVISGAGCVLYSNPNIPLFSAAGDNNPSTIYGNKERSGVIGVNWDGGVIATDTATMPGRPSPIVTNLEIDEGAGELSRKAKFTIRCFTVDQLNSIMAYYMEPGFSVFIQFGWNTPSGVKGTIKPSASNISAFQSVTNLESFRSKTNGDADVYLGFITGGNISVSDTYWDVNVKCCGFTELPAYLMVADNARNKPKENPPKPEVEDYPTSLWYNINTPILLRRWYYVFNSLPSNRKTALVKSLETHKKTNNPINFINFDPKVAEAINTKKDSSWFGRIFGGDDDIKLVGSDGTEVEVDLPDGVKLITDQRYIRFEALVNIMNKIESKAYKIGDAYVFYKINTDTTVCSAFDNIFSTDKTKLFIPNKLTPGPDFAEVVLAGNEAKRKDWVDNSVKYESYTVSFPNEGAISGGEAKNVWGEVVKIDYKYGTTSDYSKPARKWGFLNDLYVNFDFAKGIMETKNFLIKDALYQILNAMSAAAGGMWDFQIQEAPSPKNGLLELTVVEMNLANDNSTAAPVPFELTGTDSVFLEASFDMNLGGAMMNQIIGERNSKALNSSSPPASGRLFATGKTDQVLVTIYDETEKGNNKWNKQKNDNEGPAPETEVTEEYKKEAEKKFAAFLDKVALAPHVKVLPGDAEWKEDPYEANYLCAYNDQAWFESFKLAAEGKVSSGEVSILLPIKFTFTVHGVSGIKRGDKFVVRGLPQQYSDAGFFQVTGIKQVVSGMLWKTEVESAFRQNRSV